MEGEYYIGFLLSRASWAMATSVNKRLREQDLGEISMGFFGVMISLWQEDGISISELGERVKLEKSTMTGLIDRMEKASLLTRRNHPTDRRTILIHLTDKGRSVRPVVEKIVVDTFSQLTRGISREHIEITKDIIKRIIDNAEVQG